MLKKNLVGLGIRDRIQGACVAEALQRRHASALRIGDPHIIFPACMFC